MKIYAVSLAIGVLVGVIYGLLNVRSPAPPVVALVGLAGILLGEQLVPLGKRLITGESVTLAAVLGAVSRARLRTIAATPQFLGRPL